MEHLLAWALAVYGVAFIITGSKIFRPLRRALGPVDETKPELPDVYRRLPVEGVRKFFADLLYCPVCTGFWIGLGLSLAGWGVFAHPDAADALLRLSVLKHVRHVFNGGAASAVCWIAHVVLSSLGAERH